VRAATALSIAQAISASADAGAADKHARGSSADSSLIGISNDGTAGAAQLMTSSTVTDASPPTTLKVAAGVETAEFGQGVADRVSLMMDGNLTSARLQVNPPALGPIEVRIALQAGHAQVWFTSHSAVTRDALESSSPKLREMLGAQGFGQVSVDISQRSFQERSPQSHGYEGTPAISGETRASVQTASAPSRAASGLLDAYA
jgi:flagellar hook-length control protein FliK